jgi:hypothetical protein
MAQDYVYTLTGFADAEPKLRNYLLTCKLYGTALLGSDPFARATLRKSAQTFSEGPSIVAYHIEGILSEWDQHHRDMMFFDHVFLGRDTSTLPNHEPHFLAKYLADNAVPMAMHFIMLDHNEGAVQEHELNSYEVIFDADMEPEAVHGAVTDYLESNLNPVAIRELRYELEAEPASIV